MILFLVCLGFSLVVVNAGEIRRLGLFIGADRGLAAESPLKYASRDAEKVAGLFRQSGLYKAGDILLLPKARLREIRAAMDTLTAKAEAWRRAGGQTFLFVYYSGHGNADALHIRGEKMGREELLAWIGRLPGDLKIVVLDACESGDFLRTKGGRFVQDLPTLDDDRLASQGVIFITSTSKGEPAQESDEYRGGVFTHHLANGLRGLADFNRDGWIGLQESFEYARMATVTDVARAGTVPQNPSFDLDLVGGADPRLIPVNGGESSVLFRNFPPGRLDIHDAGSLGRIAQVWMSGRDSLSFRLRNGRYLFKFRKEEREYLLDAVLEGKGNDIVERGRFRERMPGIWARRGGVAVSSWGIQGVWSGLDLVPGRLFPAVGAAWARRKMESKEVLRLDFSEGTIRDTSTGLGNRIAVVRFGYHRQFFLAGSRMLRFHAGGSASAGFAKQVVTDSRFGGAPVPGPDGPLPSVQESSFLLFQAGLPLELDWNLARGWWLTGAVNFGITAFPDRGRDSWRGRFMAEPGLGLGCYF